MGREYERSLKDLKGIYEEEKRVLEGRLEKEVRS